jgi:hypothetical protein
VLLPLLFQSSSYLLDYITTIKCLSRASLTFLFALFTLISYPILIISAYLNLSCYAYFPSLSLSLPLNLLLVLLLYLSCIVYFFILYLSLNLNLLLVLTFTFLPHFTYLLRFLILTRATLLLITFFP